MAIPRVVLVDIDGVLADTNFPVLAKLGNEVLRLGMTQESLAAINSYHSFCILPEVQAYYEREGEETFHNCMKWMRFHPHHIRECILLPDAREGIEALLLYYDDLAYCTARKMSDEHWDAALSRETYDWLETNKFPNADQVLFCEQPRGKLQMVVQQLREELMNIVLIDDSAQKLLDAYREEIEVHHREWEITVSANRKPESIQHMIVVPEDPTAFPWGLPMELETAKAEVNSK